MIKYIIKGSKKFNSGSYAIILYLNDDCYIDIGKKGRYYFETGYYIYAGSGIRNLIQRVDRHFKKDKALKWHIDYLSVKCFN